MQYGLTRARTRASDYTKLQSGQTLAPLVEKVLAFCMVTDLRKVRNFL
jgi:hypothetical protein